MSQYYDEYSNAEYNNQRNSINNQPIKTNQMKKGTPTNVVSNGTWTNPNGQTYYKWNITMDNGDFGGAMTAKEQQDKWVIGKEVTYTSETKGNFTNFKVVEEKPVFGGGKVEPKQQGVITYLSCASTAANFYAQRSNGSEEQVLAFAEKLFNAAMSKKS